MHRFVPGWGERLVRLAASAAGNPVRFFVVLVAVSALAYVPLALAYSPSTMGEHRPDRVSAQPAVALPASISLPASRSGPMALIAACSPAMAFWRGAGRRGSPLPLSAFCFGPRRPP